MIEPVIPKLAETLFPKGNPINFDAPIDISNVRDKSVLITGGASGIGLACAKQLAEAGALVTIADLQSEAGSSAAKDLSSKGLKVNFVQADVTSYASQVSTFKSAIEFGGGKIDIVVPGAGIVAQQNLIDMACATEPTLEAPPPEPGFSGVDVNLKGVYYSCYLALYYFRLPRPDSADTFTKSIVLIASLAGYLGFPRSTTYSISKFGIRGLFWGIRTQAAKQDPPVRINLVAPWVVATPLAINAGLGESPVLNIIGLTPVQTVVDAVVWLAIDEEVKGRAVACMENGNFDVRDETMDGSGGVEIKKILLETLGKAEERMKTQAQAEQKLWKSESSSGPLPRAFLHL